MGPAACLVGAVGWYKARATTGARLFLNRTREDAAGVPAVDNVSVPVEPPQNQQAPSFQDKLPLKPVITAHLMARVLSRKIQGQETLPVGVEMGV